MIGKRLTLAGLVWCLCLGNPLAQAAGEDVTVTTSRHVFEKVPMGEVLGPAPWVGYTELRTNLPGGRHMNVKTMRAVIVSAEGTRRRLLPEELTKEPDTWTQFAGWSPDAARTT